MKKQFLSSEFYRAHFWKWFIMVEQFAKERIFHYRNWYHFWKFVLTLCINFPEMTSISGNQFVSLEIHSKFQKEIMDWFTEMLVHFWKLWSISKNASVFLEIGVNMKYAFQEILDQFPEIQVHSCKNLKHNKTARKDILEVINDYFNSIYNNNNNIYQPDNIIIIIYIINSILLLSSSSLLVL